MKTTLQTFIFLIALVLAFKVSDAQTDSTKQSAYYDAVFIRKNCYSEANGHLEHLNNLQAVLKKYYPGEEVSSTTLRRNPFFKDITPASLTQSTESATFVDKAINTIGGINVTGVANGIADLLIDRAKQELTVAFFDRFKKFSDANPEFKILFPKTATNLTNLLSYNYPQMLPALRSGFLDDLGKITYNLDDVMALPRYTKLLEKLPEVKVCIRSLRLVHEIESGASTAADIIQQFSQFPELADTTKNVPLHNLGSSLRVAALFSESLRNDTAISQTKNIWVSGKELKLLYDDDVTLTIYLGLIWQQSVKADIKFLARPGDKGIFFADLLAAKKDTLFLLKNKLQEFTDLAGKVNTAFTDIKGKRNAGKTLTNDDYYNYINLSVDVIDYSFSIVKIFDKIPANTQLDKYIAITRTADNLYKDIYTKQYTQGVSDALDVFIQIDTLRKPAKIDLKTLKNNINDALANTENYASIKAALSDLEDGKAIDDAKASKIISAVTDTAVKNKIQTILDFNNAQKDYTDLEKYLKDNKLDRLSKFAEQVKPYALFMANMIEAKDEKAVEAALQNVILPVGSSSIKKNAVFNLSVQSYLGAYLTLIKRSADIPSTWSDKFGVTAPIGVEASLGLKKVGSVSLFASLFDLGAIVDYKLTNNTVATGTSSSTTTLSKDYSVKLGQLFSPGVYVVYGLPWNLPLSLGFGPQYGPGLSKIDNSNIPVVVNPSWRWNAFLSVDIPLFTLINKTHTKQ